MSRPGVDARRVRTDEQAPPGPATAVVRSPGARDARVRRERTWSALDEANELGQESFAGMDVAVRELGLPAYGSAYLGAD